MINNAVFIPVFLFSMVFFAYSVAKKFSLVRLGKAEMRTDRIGERISTMFANAIGQKRVVSGKFGFNHAMLFWSFLVLVLLNAEFLLNGLFPQISFLKLPAGILYPLKGLFEVVSVLVLVAVTAAAVRKIVSPLYPESRTFEAFFILSLIGTLMIAYFGITGAEIALGKLEASAFMPVSGLFAGLYSGMSAEAIHSAGAVFWWIHAAVLLGFMNFLPYSKHMHIITAIPNVFFRELEKPVLPKREKFELGEELGAEKATDLSWKDLMDSMTCTECGRCQTVCPASLTDKPMNPRTMIHEIKMSLSEKDGKLIENGAHSISKDAIWSCVTCGACMEVCPVFIEHVPKTIKMRRHLVQMESDFPEELLNLFENMEQRSNPWGIAPSERTKWTSVMDVKDFKEGETEYLFFVGCAGAFDSRSKQVTVTLASIMDKAGVSWGILGKDELCCGDSARRLGNEYVFEEMALKNVEMFKERGVKKIITQCPHCFTTLANDYKQYGIELEVIHHSKLISDLVNEGRLTLNGAMKDKKIAVHDSCYLGRHNGIYEEPRNVISKSTGNNALEMASTREESFCCGAGGGRMWMEEDLGSRMNTARVQQAADTDAEIICTSCPYCMTMMQDGVKDIGAEEKLQVMDIAELAAYSAGLDK
jgi:Fe-S oxidoreductase